VDFVVAQTYLGDILTIVSNALLAPVIVLLLLFIGYAVWCIGSILVEIFTERRSFKANMPEFLSDLMDADQDGIPLVIEKSGLLNRQKIALLTVYDYRKLPGDSLVALIKRVMNDEDTHYRRILNRNNIAARVAPMLGLMGTLIPLGPGIAAMGQGQLDMLSSSLVIAFSTTVAGLAAAAVCLVVARVRKTWYDGYMNALESAMATILQKVEGLREKGEIVVTEPTNHAFLYARSLKRASADILPDASIQSGEEPVLAEESPAISQDDGDEVAEAAIEDGSELVQSIAVEEDPAPDDGNVIDRPVPVQVVADEPKSAPALADEKVDDEGGEA